MTAADRRKALSCRLRRVAFGSASLFSRKIFSAPASRNSLICDTSEDARSYALATSARGGERPLAEPQERAGKWACKSCRGMYVDVGGARA